MSGVKSTIKNILNNHTGCDRLRYCSQEPATEYVSFDIFDTLIVRDVNKPTDVFLMLEKALHIPDFCRHRIEAEQSARLKKPSKEVTLEEIYLCFPGATAEKIKELCQRELEMELLVCHPNRRVIGFYRECVKKKKVVLVSDMYLPSEMMRQLLDHCGIQGYEKLYVSCDVEQSKHNGDLFRYVLSDLKISSGDIIHIGNDFISDGISAERVGIQTVKIQTRANHVLAGKSLAIKANRETSFSLVYNYINNTTCSNSKFNDFYYRFGYETFGVLLFGFCKWLVEEAEKQGVEQVLFIARDGYILKCAYDAMGLSLRIPSYYLEVSRRSMRVPTSFSVPQDYKDAIKLISATKRISIGQILDSWGVRGEDCAEELKLAGITSDEVFWKADLENNEDLINLYGLLQEKLIANGQAEKRALEKYLEQFNLEKKTALVDIGYGGTIQKELTKALLGQGKTPSLFGYYIVLDEERSKENANGLPLNMFGYIQSNYKVNKRSADINQYVGLFETMFLEQTGSVKRYIENGERIDIERYEYEYDVPGGEVNETQKVRLIQAGALDFIVSTQNSILGKLKIIKSDDAFYFLDHAFSKPNRAILNHFFNFRFFNMGEAVLLANPRRSPFGYAMHPEELRVDFFESMWKTGYLRKMFGFNVPYKTIRDIHRLRNSKM